MQEMWEYDSNVLYVVSWDSVTFGWCTNTQHPFVHIKIRCKDKYVLSKQWNVQFINMSGQQKYLSTSLTLSTF